MIIPGDRHVASPKEVERWQIHNAYPLDAMTHYKVLAQFKLNDRPYSYVHVQPITGRTHQIRYHFQQIGHPLVGEGFYVTQEGQPDRLPQTLKQFFPKNPALHAQEVSFVDPQSHEEVQIFCQPPIPFEDALEFLEEYKI